MATNNRHITCPAEEMYIEDGYVVIHDGQNASSNTTLQGIEQRFFTRTLRKKEDGKFVDKWVVFRYDLRRTPHLVNMKPIKCDADGIKRYQNLRGELQDSRSGIEAGG